MKRIALLVLVAAVAVMFAAPAFAGCGCSTCAKPCPTPCAKPCPAPCPKPCAPCVTCPACPDTWFQNTADWIMGRCEPCVDRIPCPKPCPTPCAKPCPTPCNTCR